MTDISLLNEDAKSLYKDLDYKNKSLEELISSLISIAKEKNISTANVDITTNWPNNKDILVVNYRLIMRLILVLLIKLI